MRLLFVYGAEPSGHASAARALEECARERGLEAACFNVSVHHSWLGPLVARAYIALIQRFPGLWRALYDNERVAHVALAWRKAYLFFHHRKLERAVARLKPDVIVCTHAPPLGALSLQKERGRLDCALAGVVTDFNAHAYWVRSGADLYLAAAEETKRRMLERGIQSGRVEVTGIPVHSTFAEPLAQADARKSLGLPAWLPTIFLSGGSRGLGRLAAAVRALLAGLGDCRLLVATGGNAALLRALRERFPREGRLRAYAVLGAPAIKELMCASDLLVGKAGGVTVSEALAVGLPMVFFEPIPGQEAANAAYLVEQGAALPAESLGGLAARVREALEPGRHAALRAQSRKLGRPDSAGRVLDAIAERFALH